MPLPEDAGLVGNSDPRVHRFRTLGLQLGRQLRAFREAQGLTQADVAQIVGASNASAVSQWETGIAVPDGVRRRRVQELVRGELGSAVRAQVVRDGGFPEGWRQAVRWYRRASRTVACRRTAGVEIAGILHQLRSIADLAVLVQGFVDKPALEIQAVSPISVRDIAAGTTRRVEHAAYGLRWLEITHACSFNLLRSIVADLPLAWLNEPVPNADSPTGPLAGTR